MTNRFASVLALCASFALPAALSGQDQTWNRYTLEDLDGVHIQFEVDETCQAAGLASSDFEASTSLQLIEADVGVLTREEMLENLALPELRVSLDCVEDAGGPMAYVVGLRVQQAAQMLRDTQITLPEAVTWYSTRLGVTSAADAAADIGEALTAELGLFAEAWKAANAEAERSR